MGLSMDPQVRSALDRMVAGLGEIKPRPAVGDWPTLRQSGNAMFRVWAALQPVPTDVMTRDDRRGQAPPTSIAKNKDAPTPDRHYGLLVEHAAASPRTFLRRFEARPPPTAPRYS
jgi:hypothetical protein